MMGVIQAVGQTASNTNYLRDKTIAHWVAMNRLTEARLQPQSPKVDKSSDEVEMADRKWRWTMTVTQTDVQTIRRIDISVRPADAEEESSLASISGFYGAAIAPPGSTLVSWQGSSTPAQGDGDGTRQRRPRDGGKNPRTPAPPSPVEPGDPVDAPPEQEAGE
jgi:general secretion pathway protein I